MYMYEHKVGEKLVWVEALVIFVNAWDMLKVNGTRTMFSYI